MPNPNETTGSLTYIKLLMIAKLFRGGFILGSNLGNLFGNKPPMSIDPQNITGEAIDIPSSRSRGRIRVTVYRNQAAINAEKIGGKSAVHIHWHGGGWMLPHTTYQTLPYITTLLASPLLASYPLTIFDATYALSPEHPCPAELEDAKDVYDYILTHQNKWDIDRMSLSGNSSGGSIALGLAVTLGKEARDASQGNEWSHPIKAVFVCYAMTNWIGIGEKNAAFLAALPANAPAMVMPNFVLDTIAAAHFFSPSGSARKDSGTGENGDQKGETETARKVALQRSPMVSPALADVRDFPPKVGIWTVEWDVMSADADELRERLKGQRVDGKGGVSGRMIKGVGHGWDLEVHRGQVGWEEKEEAYQDLIKAVAWVGGLVAE